MKYIYILIIIYILSACNENNKNSNPGDKVIDPTIESPEPSTLSQLIGNYRLIKLETTDDCLINKETKVIKHKGKFYISSDEEILIFNNNGSYINKLSKRGNGPEDYLCLEDFNIYNTNGNDEIWICDVQNIKKYDATNFELKDLFKTEGENVKRFERIDNDLILTRTSGEYMFILFNNQGKIIQKYQKKDLANSAYKSIPFIIYAGDTLYQIDDTNTGVSYKNGRFIEKDIIHLSSKKILTPKNNQEYYKEYGYLKQCEEINKIFTRIHTIQSNKEKTLLITLHPQKDMITIIDKKNGIKTYQIYPNSSSLKNDIIPTKDMNFLKTISGCKSDDSFLFKVPISELSTYDNIKKEQNGNTLLSDLNEEDNMLLLEFY